MLRTLRLQGSELVQQCHLKNWRAVSQRLQTHPQEATPNDASLQGHGTTVLAVAIRAGAPLYVIESLLQACVHQIAVVNRSRGSVLHEAIQQGASNEILSHLVHVMTEYQAETRPTMLPRHDNSSNFSDSCQFIHVGVQDSRIIHRDNLFLAQDNLGRTALHLLIERVTAMGEHYAQSKEIWNMLHLLVRACPDSAKTVDCDGNTPLILLLLIPRGPRSSRTETLIVSLTELMLSLCPDAVTINRRIVRPWKLQTNFATPFLDDESLNGTVNQTPLYYALLNGRSLETIILLLKHLQMLKVPSCHAVVTQFHEVPLHIAISTRAPLSIIYHLASDCPQAILVEDIYGLSSIDWLWIRHVLDWHTNPLDVSSSRIISRRRLLDNHFLDWQTMASNHIPIGDTAAVPVNPVAVRGLQEDLLQRMKLLLPLAATVLAKNDSYGQTDHWPLIHAACYVSCPIGMVRAALYMVGETRHSIRTKDLKAGRLPLHYAAARAGYSGTVPVGITRSVQVIRERSAVFDVARAYPEACFELDNAGQLPLHIVIDSSKQTRAPLLCGGVIGEVDQEEQTILSELLLYNPGALEHRDGKTGLFPWQQAATGYGCSTSTIFFLLRLQPTLLSS